MYESPGFCWVFSLNAIINRSMVVPLVAEHSRSVLTEFVVSPLCRYWCSWYGSAHGCFPSWSQNGCIPAASLEQVQL